MKEPEDVLLFSVVEKALQDIFRTIKDINEGKEIKISSFTSAYYWLIGKPNPTHPMDRFMSFESLCCILDLDRFRIIETVDEIIAGVRNVPDDVLSGSLWRSNKSKRTTRICSESAYIKSATLTGVNRFDDSLYSELFEPYRDFIGEHRKHIRED